MMDWMTWHLEHAKLAALKSKDTTQVGAALVDENGVVRMTAFNGPPMGVADLQERFERPDKYLWASHAEQNLIAFAARSGVRTEGCTVYVTHTPCSTCARMLIQAGVVEVVAGDGTTHMATKEFEAAKQMFSEAGVKYVQTA